MLEVFKCQIDVEAAEYVRTACYDPAFTEKEVNKTENLHAANSSPSRYLQEIVYPA